MTPLQDYRAKMEKLKESYTVLNLGVPPSENVLALMSRCAELGAEFVSGRVEEAYNNVPEGAPAWSALDDMLKANETALAGVKGEKV